MTSKETQELHERIHQDPELFLKMLRALPHDIKHLLPSEFNPEDSLGFVLDHCKALDEARGFAITDFIRGPYHHPRAYLGRDNALVSFFFPAHSEKRRILFYSYDQNKNPSFVGELSSWDGTR